MNSKENIIDFFIQSKTTSNNNPGVQEDGIGVIIKKIEEKVEPDIIDREKFKDAATKVRGHLCEKINEFISSTEHTYFFKYTKFSVRRPDLEEETEMRERRKGKIQENKIEEAILRRNVIQIDFPLSINETMLLDQEDKLPYIIKKFDTEFLPRFDSLLKKEIGSEKKNWTYKYCVQKGQAYQRREQDI
jgi:hypothetical protein